MRWRPTPCLSPRGRRYNRSFMRTGRANRGYFLSLFLATLSLFAPAAAAKVQLSVDVGWSNRFRAGRWTPLYVTLADSSPRQVVVEVYTPTDHRYALRAVQGLAIGPTPVTVALYAPLSYRVDEASIVMRDANSNKRLDDYILS